MIQHIEDIRTDSGIKDFRFFHVMGDHKFLMYPKTAIYA
ncbi:hypothetical protein KNP414_04258 [Paenibacillus mucilaginosus KNP414]|uniref:Uncharacterized protein n=1 Tax=Paenibacillus mucilaginosus (strain KNP414) TaxID=1036673 RepID=F8FHT3_PAEMK|nr:hypothetical protein KNP414_04258 [Paenibacillus mucilaginosus KNP414]